jgi:hypothetical protein
MRTTYQLFLGRNIPTGGVVTDKELQEFITDTLDSTFDGYSLQAVDGVWKGKHEDTVLASFCTDDKEAVMRVARTYKKRFNQDSVAMQELPAMSFV